MLSNLTTRQRMALVFSCLAAGQGCVIAGLSAGWSHTTIVSSSVGATVLGMVILASGAAVLRKFVQECTTHASRIASGDLSVDIPNQGDSDAAQVLHSLQALQVSLRQALGGIRGGADGVSVAATEIATGNADLSTRTEQTASNLQQAASSMARLTGTVNQTADSARTANQLASSASEVAARGGSVVAQVVSTMNEINTSSKKIADIIGTIDGIAFQTNILALNAAVEAARAGEQGRGFAVVASEVRSLAQRSAEAAREIKGLIGASVEKVESGSRLVQDAGNTMTEIVASVHRVSDIIGEISAAAAEQSAGIGQVNSAVTQLDQMTQQNAALVEESAAAAESLKEQSRHLATAVATFQIGGRATATATAPAPRSLAKTVIHQAQRAPTTRAAAPPAQAAVANKPAKVATGNAVAAAAPAPRAAAPAPAKAAASADAEWEAF